MICGTLSDKDVIEYVAPSGKIIPQRCLKHVLGKHGLYDYIVNRFDDNTLSVDDNEYLRECIYRIVYGINEIPRCKICGKPITFKYNCYSKYCSRKCSNGDKEVVEKISKSCSDSLKQKYKEDGESIKKKRKETLTAKYGVNATSSPFSINEIQDASKNIILEKYGVDNAFKIDWVKNKRKEKQRQDSIKLQKNRNIDIEYLKDGNYLVKNCCDIHGDLVFTQTEFNNRFKPNRYCLSNPCYICNPFGNHVSGQQKTLLEYIKIIYKGEIIENDKKALDGLEIDIYLPELKIGFEFNGDYWHMNPINYRYDDINQSTKLSAIETWKKDIGKLFIAEEKGIMLFHVWEYYYKNETDSVKDFISNLVNNNIQYVHPIIKLKRELDIIDPNYTRIDDTIFEYDDVRIVYMDSFYFNKNTIPKQYITSLISDTKRTIFVYCYEITDERKFKAILSDIRYALHKIGKRIYARKCEIREISNKDSKDFLMENSLFGYRSASKVLGLYYKGELVMVYSFGNNYYGRKKDTEVIRVCTKLNTQVIGGSSKCLKYYIDNYAKNGETIVFYMDAIHHNGSSMKNDGFEYVKHEFGLMNCYISFDRFGEAFNRNPNRNKEIKEMVDRNEIVEVITNGVDVYKKVIKK